MCARALLVLAVVWLSLSCKGRPTPAASAPSGRTIRDVVLITIDTLRADAVGFDGNARGTTPVLDRFAAEGRVFPVAHAHNVVTLPSHANILTGLYPYQHGVRDNAGFRLDRGVRDRSRRGSRRAGYATGAFVAAFPLDSRYGLSRGFETYDELYRHLGRAPRVRHPAEPGRRGRCRGARLVVRAQSGKARFLWVHLYDPHAPYDPPEPLRQPFPRRPVPGRGRRHRRVPRAAARRRSGQRSRRALVIVTADHGEARGDHGELTHGLFAYESTLNVPLVVWSPGLVSPGQDDRSARHVDILPTILAAAGADRRFEPSRLVPARSRGRRRRSPTSSRCRRASTAGGRRCAA